MPPFPAVPAARPVRSLVADLPDARIDGDDVAVGGLCYDSRAVREGDLFFCVPGARTDGHAHAATAAAAGAAAAVVERRLDLALPQVVVPSVRAAMGPISSAFHAHPSRAMTVVGITGTNGKTTTTYLVESILARAGRSTAIIGTTGIRVGGTPRPFARTTPEAPDLQAILREVADAGSEAVAMEVSSHGLDQHRVDGTRFACAVFTNLSQDHLDYHPDMESYFRAKARLFDPAFTQIGITNVDDAHGRRLAGAPVAMTTYAIDADAEIRAEGVHSDERGSSFHIGGLEVRTPLRGRFNVENALAAFAVGRALGIDDATIVEGIAAVTGVPGRVETVDAGQPFLVLVDYAHTPDGITNVLGAARPIARGRLIIVFGCGGDRDRAKRPLMGEAATSAADLTVVTSDNPRSEEPAAIIAEIEPGARRGGGEYVIEVDRRRAIRTAFERAGEGDVVVIAGKGHETGQEFADVVLPFDDREVALEELRALGVAS